MKNYSNSAALAATIDEKQGPSDWVTVDQAMINAFADVTGDHQWIHVDPKRAATEMPGGKTIAHGYLTLSLMTTLVSQVYNVDAKQTLNVGLEKLRFLSPVPEGTRIRLYMTVKNSAEAENGRRITAQAEFEMEGVERPAMIADLIFLYID